MDVHVVIVSDDACASGGASAVALTSAKALASQGIRVTLFAGRGPVDDALRAELHDVVCLDRGASNREGGGALRGLWDAESSAHLRRVVEAIQGPKVVHFHAFADVLTGSVTAVPKALGVPALFTMHEYGLACPYGGFYNYRTGAPCGQKGLSAGCWSTPCSTAPYPRKLWRAGRLSLQRARGGAPQPGATYLCVSEFSRDVMTPYLPTGARIELVPNPIDIPDEGIADTAASDTFLYVGRLTEEKGAAVFAQAAGLAGVRAVFVGDGDQKDELVARHPDCVFEGWLDPSEVRARLRTARALVFPSRLYETLGMSVLEAAAAGVPSIVSDVTAAAATIEPGVNGLHFKSGDPVSLAAAMEGLDGMSAARMGAEAYKRHWQDPPTLARHVARLIEIYASVGGVA